MTKELNNLLALIFQDGRTVVKDGQLLAPPELARTFGDQIKRLKPEILIALGHCPICGREVTVKVEGLRSQIFTDEAKTGRHTFCQTLGHFDKWEF